MQATASLLRDQIHRDDTSTPCRATVAAPRVPESESDGVACCATAAVICDGYDYCRSALRFSVATLQHSDCAADWMAVNVTTRSPASYVMIITSENNDVTFCCRLLTVYPHIRGPGKKKRKTLLVTSMT